MEHRHSSHTISQVLKSTLTSLQDNWTPSSDNRWTEDWLRLLMVQHERRGDYEPRANLCIRTDIVGDSCALCMSIADLAHACLSNYFSPYRDAASIMWVNKDAFRQFMLTPVVENNSDEIESFISDMLTVENKLVDTDAIMYVSRDARDFMSTHRESFMDTLATCLRTTRDRILVQDMCFCPV